MKATNKKRATNISEAKDLNNTSYPALVLFRCVTYSETEYCEYFSDIMY